MYYRGSYSLLFKLCNEMKMLDVCGLEFVQRKKSDVFVAMCYFASVPYPYACPRRQSPYTIIDEHIKEFAREGINS